MGCITPPTFKKIDTCSHAPVLVGPQIDMLLKHGFLIFLAPFLVGILRALWLLPRYRNVRARSSRVRNCLLQILCRCRSAHGDRHLLQLCYNLGSHCVSVLVAWTLQFQDCLCRSQTFGHLRRGPLYWTWYRAE
jgi:hypothetical protein